MRILIRVTFFALAIVLASAPPASAGNSGDNSSGVAEETATGGVVRAERTTPGGSAPGNGGGGSSTAVVVPCFGSLVAGDAARQFVNPPELVADETDQWMVVTCWLPGGDPGANWIAGVFRSGEPTLVAALVQRASDLLVVPEPQPALAPPIDALHLVGIPEYLAIEPHTWQPRTATGQIPELTITLTATPLHTRWDMGNGDTATCDGPGTRWRPKLDPTDACTYTYQWPSTTNANPSTSNANPSTTNANAYTITVHTTWTRTWTCTPNCGTGTLTPLDRSMTFPLVVRQAQATIVINR